MSKNIEVTLTSCNMGDAEESDFDAWVSYVADHIDEACGFVVEVDAFRFGASQVKDALDGGTDEQQETVREALSRVWDNWCAEGAPGVSRAP